MLNKIILLLIIIFSLINIKIARAEINSPESLSQYMKEEFTYQKDWVDYWKTPAETLKDKGGDCEDFAFFVQQELRKIGYETIVIAISGRQDGKKYCHAICIFKVNGKYNYFSNQFYHVSNEFDSIKELVEFECEEWKKWAEISLPHEFTNWHYNITTN